MDHELEMILETVRQNKLAGKDNCFDGLDSSQIGRYSRYLMFGPNDEAWPGNAAWSRIVD